MKLIQIDIIDFKSVISESLHINSNQLCIVGKNESGKSSIIKAISYLNILETEFESRLLNKSSERYPSGYPILIGLFKFSKNSYINFYKILLKYFSKELLSHIPTKSDTCLLQIKRWGNGFSNISISIAEKGKFGFDISKNLEQKAEFYDVFFSDIYPSIDYFENEELLIEPATVEELKGNNRDFETFRRLLVIGGCNELTHLDSDDINFITTYLSDIEGKLNKIFKKHYKQDDSINIRIVPTFDNKLNLIIRDSSGKSFSINERSPGFQYYFSFLVNKLYTKQMNHSKNSIIILDEPGNGLHPNGAKDLLKSFDEISESSQIIYTTHNPFLAIRNCIDSLIYVHKNPELGTKINKKTFLNKYQIIRRELGILLNDSFLIGDINLIVEGNTEKLLFHRLFQFENYQHLQWLNIYNADGVSNIPQAVNYLGKNNLNLSGILILDSDREAVDIKVNKSYKSNLSQPNWEEIEVNSVYGDQSERTIEDIFPQELYINAFNDYCNSLKTLEVFDKDYENYVYEKELKTPIINELNLHFKKFIAKENKTSITKQDVIRHLLDYTDNLPLEEQKKHLFKAFELVDKISGSFKKIERHAFN